MRFRYPRVHFGIRYLLLLGIMASLLLVLWIPDTDRTWLAAFGIICFIAISLVTLTPMLTRHEITESSIILRQGLVFQAKFPLKEIECVKSTQARLWAFGLFQARAKGRMVLANGNRNLVSIKLKESRRFGMLLMRSASEIIIDLERPGDFVDLANEMLGR